MVVEKEVGLMKKLSKKKVIIEIIVFLIIALIIVFVIYLNVRIVDDNSGFTLKDDLTAEVYSDVKVKDYIDTIQGDILSFDSIDTEKLGKQEISFIYLNSDDKKRRGTFEVEVVDTEEPLVWVSSSYSTPIGEPIDFEKTVICVDNYDNKPSCQIEGEYDVNTPGTYNLTFVAEDSSKNTFSRDFSLVVYQETVEDDNSKTPASEESGAEVPVTNFSDVLANYKTSDNEIGIDVSRYQGDVDFKKVKDAGASFVMIRVGYQVGTGGEYELDPYFKDNIKKALGNDLKVGVYFYSYADSEKEAKKQAKWVIKQIKDYDISLPVVFDFESFNAFNEMELSIFGLNEVADSFIKTLDKAGYDGMLYGSKNYLNAIWKYHEEPVWLAHYTDNTDYDGEYMMWQMCDDGVIDGIDGYVDIDILYKNSSSES